MLRATDDIVPFDPDAGAALVRGAFSMYETLVKAYWVDVGRASDRFYASTRAFYDLYTPIVPRKAGQQGYYFELARIKDWRARWT